MDWRNNILILLALLPLAKCWTYIKPAAPQSVGRKSAVSPYIDIALCPIQQQPWSCAREQSARILDIWDDELHSQWQKLKVEADRQLNATIEKRGYSATEIPTKEKPSTILRKIEIGTSFMKDYLAESMDGFLGHEFEYMQSSKKEADDEDYDGDADSDHDEETLDEVPAEDDDDDDDDNDNDEDDDEQEDDDEKNNNEADDDKSVEKVNANTNKNTNANTYIAPNANSYNTIDAFDADKSVTTGELANNSNGDEFIEIDDVNHVEQLKQPGDSKKKKNKKTKLKKKKGQKGQQHLGQPATLLVVQQAEPQHDVHQLHSINQHPPLQTSESSFGGHGHKKGDKRKKRKKRPGHSDSVSTVIVEEAPSNHLGFELLEELVGEQELFSTGGGKRKRKNKHPSKYGRSNGVTRGKKKKKKKAIAKLILLGSILKAKIELLLKILGAHLQIKFFAIALIGLLINIARFWIDVKRGGVPQKVIYVEHAHHQHHYEDNGEDWSEGGAGGASGGYWKRSLQTDPTVGDNVEAGFTDSYQPQQPQQPQQLNAQYLAYRNQWH